MYDRIIETMPFGGVQCADVLSPPSKHKHFNWENLVMLEKPRSLKTEMRQSESIPILFVFFNETTKQKTTK